MQLGFDLFEALDEAGYDADEVFPAASYKQLVDEDVVFSLSTHSLARGPRDVLDATLAAITVHEYSEGRGCAVGGEDGFGTIVLPRRIAPTLLQPLRWPGPSALVACSICHALFDGHHGPSGFESSFARDYPGIVCGRCDESAVGAAGGAPDMQLETTPERTPSSSTA